MNAQLALALLVALCAAAYAGWLLHTLLERAAARAEFTRAAPEADEPLVVRLLVCVALAAAFTAGAILP